MKRQRDIYTMNLHESRDFVTGDNQIFFITRVAGGWLYNLYLDDTNITTTFVPFDNEFMRNEVSNEPV